MRVLRNNQRSGAVALECAIIYPVVFLLLIGLMVGALGVFRYQEMASLARRAARYAVVHGSQYAQDTTNTAASSADIYNNAVKPFAVSLDLSKLNCSVTYNTDNRPYRTSIVNGQVVAITNIVSVTLTFNCIPEAFLGGMTFTSTSSMPMAY